MGIVTISPSESAPTVNLNKAAAMLVDLLNKYGRQKRGA